MIRKGQKEDSAQIARIKVKNYQSTYKGIFSENFLNSLNVEDEEKKYLENFDSRDILVYEEDGKILGYIYYGKRKNNSTVLEDYDGEIYAIYVDVDFKRNGIGTKLLKQAMLSLIKKYKKIILWCAEENVNAKEFYIYNNFKLVASQLGKIRNETIPEQAFVFDFCDICGYKLSRFVSYIENNENIAIYANFNLIFLKEESKNWFYNIINKNNTNEIPVKFFNYLLEKEVIEFV